MSCIEGWWALFLMASLLAAAFSGAAETSDSLPLTATLPEEISVEIVNPLELVGFSQIEWSELPKLCNDTTAIMVSANVPWLLYIKANYDYMTSQNSSLSNQMTAQVVMPAAPDPIVATVSKTPARLFAGVAGENKLQIQFDQLFTDQDKPGSYKLNVVYQGTAA
jgi:hypothetical protein